MVTCSIPESDHIQIYAGFSDILSFKSRVRPLVTFISHENIAFTFLGESVNDF